MRKSKDWMLWHYASRQFLENEQRIEDTEAELRTLRARRAELQADAVRLYRPGYEDVPV